MDNSQLVSLYYEAETEEIGKMSMDAISQQSLAVICTVKIDILIN